MQSASPVHQMPWYKNLRRGQREIVDLILVKARVVAKLPTGYGKTRAAAAAFASLRAAGIANRMLLIVPRTKQLEQGGEDIPRDLIEHFGIDAKSWTVEDNDIATLRAHKNNELEIFVIMVQRLTHARGMTVVQELLKFGNWFVVVDEHHHYSLDVSGSAWTERVAALPCVRMLAMSATPHRRDDKSTFGAFGRPDVTVTYHDALEIEKAVKPLELHAYDYRAEFVRINGARISFTTAELMNLAPDGNLDKFVASREMRWNVDYVTPLIYYPAQRMVDQRVNGISSQMLVIAMSVEHAKVTCEQIRSLLPGWKVDWCGTGPDGRNDADNARILDEFCPAKNPLTGRRHWTLDVLVSCNMAGEGLDTVDVTEIVFLTCPQINNTTLQAIGRGCRVMPQKPQPTCFINVDCSSPLMDYSGELVQVLFDELPDTPKPRKPQDDPEPPDEPEYDPLPPFTLEVTKVELVDVRTHPAYAYSFRRVRAEFPATVSDERIHAHVEKAIQDWQTQMSQPLNQASLIAVKKIEIENRMRKLAWLTRREVTRSYPELSHRKDLIGNLCERINKRKARSCGSVNQITKAEQLIAHAEFLSQLEHEILNNGVPSWLW